MPRAKNPGAQRRRAIAARRTLQVESAMAALRAGRTARAVEAALASVPNAAHLRRMEVRALAQARIDALELAQYNDDRAQLGLPPLDALPPGDSARVPL